MANNIIFDRNDGQTHERPIHVTRPQVRNGRGSNAVVKQRVVNKLLDIMSIHNDINNFKPEFIINNPNVIDEDMFIVGEINNNNLVINIPPINIQINLTDIIRIAITEGKPSIVRLMLKRDIDVFNLEPNIMLMCAEYDQDELMLELMKKKIPIYPDNYKCIYQLASDGKLQLLKIILETYDIFDITEVVSKICIQAILYDHLHILQHFLTRDAFHGAPDVMFILFLKSIEHNADLKIIDFFIKNGINIKQSNYLAVRNAIKFNRRKIIAYFYDTDESIIKVLTDKEKAKFNLSELKITNQYIGTQVLCNITHDEIPINSKFFQCTKKIHHFNESAWKKWVKNRMEWQCPNCLANVDRVVYVNCK